MAGVGRKLVCAVVADSQEALGGNALISFQQYAEATVVTEGDQEFHVYPIWPGQRSLAVTFDAVFLLLRTEEIGKVVKERETWSNVCHRYVVEINAGAASDLVLMALQAEILTPEDCPTWKHRLIQDYRAFSAKIKSLFDQFDTEGTGSFTVNTFSSKMPEKGLGSTELQHLYEDIDKERDFKIDLVELESWWRKGRKGESRSLINAAVEKFLPWEIALRDFPTNSHYAEVNLSTSDALDRLSVVEMKGQNGPCPELLPHVVSGMKGNAWGLLFDPAEAAAAAETLAPLELTESKAEQSVAFYLPLEGLPERNWSCFKATLQFAASPEFLRPSTFHQAIFQSFSLHCITSSASDYVINAKFSGSTRLFPDFSASKIPQLRDIWTSLQSLLAYPDSSVREEICNLEGDKLRLFWITETFSVLFTLKMPFWQRLKEIA